MCGMQREFIFVISSSPQPASPSSIILSLPLNLLQNSLTIILLIINHFPLYFQLLIPVPELMIAHIH